MRAGYFSPMPPAPTGVADYSAALLPYLRALGEVHLDAASADVNLYHLGNNQLHRGTYLRALAQPGVVVLHDAVLHHFLLGTLERGAYLDEFVYNYGEWARGLGEQLWSERARSGSDPRYFGYPMIRRAVETARAVVVHNPRAARLVREHAPGASLAEIPHLFRRPDLALPQSRKAAVFTAGVFGHLRETKRLHVIVRAFHQALEAGADINLAVCGEPASAAYERSLEPLLRHPRIRRTGYLPGDEFWRQAASVDVCINLRYPTAGETSGIAIALMGIGKPVIFTAGEEVARYPEGACLEVAAGPGEEEQLAACLCWLVSDREAAQEIGRRAAAHIAGEHAPEKVARSYWEVLRASAVQVKNP
jgi:glycosyltransferase involved in cell wall biosynthesis